ncbi:MAG: SPOR domain-containing protein [Magnetococcales bacterium]|nr:SPOR domain-containing protein [Magnetococcales bacterium]
MPDATRPGWRFLLVAVAGIAWSETGFAAGDPEALATRCQALFRQSVGEKRADLARQAIADCSESIRLQPGNARVWRLRGAARLVTGNTEKALLNFDRALQLDSGDALARRYRGLAHLIAGQANEALADFQAALLLDPDQAWNHFNRGLLLGRAGQGGEAEAEFSHFVRARGAKAVEFLALMLREHPENDVVRKAIEAVLSKTPAPEPPAAPTPPPEPATQPTPSPEPATQSAPPPEPATQPAPAKAAAQGVAKPATSGREFVFKLGSYQERGNAEGLIRKLANLALPMYTEEAEIGGRMFHRVWVGPFGDEAAARDAFDRVAQQPGLQPEPVRAR